MKKFFVSLSLLAALLVVGPVFAEELIYEEDPDEPSVVLDEGSRQLGYERLFQLQAEEMEGLRAVIAPAEKDIFQLQGQLSLLQQSMLRLVEVKNVLEEKSSKLRSFDEKLQIQQDLIGLELKSIVEKFQKLVKFSFQIRQHYLLENGQINLWSLFANALSPADVQFQDYVLGTLHQQLMKSLEELLKEQLELKNVRGQLNRIGTTLGHYQEQAALSERVLAEQQAYQQQLLSQRTQERDFFAKELEIEKLDREDIEKRIRMLASQFTEDDLGGALESMAWPVEAYLGISTHFLDADYKKRFGIQHEGIDIPVDQLTAVRAPLSGKVIKVHQSGGIGYNYLQLAHDSGLSTVYGHLYAIKVQEGDLVARGQIIALSGGAPGTTGSGKLTTGPHLHFEVLENGEHRDPLLYLPKM